MEVKAGRWQHPEIAPLKQNFFRALVENRGRTSQQQSTRGKGEKENKGSFRGKENNRGDGKKRS